MKAILFLILTLFVSGANANALELTEKENIECAAIYLLTTSIFELNGKTHLAPYAEYKALYELYGARVPESKQHEVDALSSKYFAHEEYSTVRAKAPYCREMAYRYYL